MSWLEAASVFPISVTQVCPEGYEVSQETIGNLSPKVVVNLVSPTIWTKH